MLNGRQIGSKIVAGATSSKVVHQIARRPWCSFWGREEAAKRMFSARSRELVTISARKESNGSSVLKSSLYPAYQPCAR